MSTCRINVAIGHYDLDVEVEFEYEPYDPGVRYLPDGSGIPPSGDQLDINGAKVLSITNNLDYQTIEREWLVARGYAKMWDAYIFDLCIDSGRGDPIYDAVYVSMDERF